MTFEELKEKYDNCHYSRDNEIRMTLSNCFVAICDKNGRVRLFYSSVQDRRGCCACATMELGERSFENIDKLFGALKGEEK